MLLYVYKYTFNYIDWQDILNSQCITRSDYTSNRVMFCRINIYQLTNSTLEVEVINIKDLKRLIGQIQGQGHRVKNIGTHREVLSQWILMWKTNIKALTYTVQKLLQNQG